MNRQTTPYILVAIAVVFCVALANYFSNDPANAPKAADTNIDRSFLLLPGFDSSSKGEANTDVTNTTRVALDAPELYVDHSSDTALEKQLKDLSEINKFDALRDGGGDHGGGGGYHYSNRHYGGYAGEYHYSGGHHGSGGGRYHPSLHEYWDSHYGHNYGGYHGGSWYSGSNWDGYGYNPPLYHSHHYALESPDFMSGLLSGLSSIGLGLIVIVGGLVCIAGGVVAIYTVSYIVYSVAIEPRVLARKEREEMPGKFVKLDAQLTAVETNVAKVLKRVNLQLGEDGKLSSDNEAVQERLKQQDCSATLETTIRTIQEYCAEGKYVTLHLRHTLGVTDEGIMIGKPSAMQFKYAKELLAKPLFKEKQEQTLEEMKAFDTNEIVDSVCLDDIADRLEELFEDLKWELEDFPKTQANILVVRQNVLEHEPSTDEGFILHVKQDETEGEPEGKLEDERVLCRA